MTRGNDDERDPRTGRFGRWHQLGLALGGVLGSGWIISILAATGAGWFAMLSWLLALAAIGLITVIVVQLARARPAAAGLVSWPTNTSGRAVGTVLTAGLAVVYAGNPPAGVAAAVIALDKFGVLPGMTQQCTPGAGGLPPLSYPGVGVAAVLLTAMFLINLIGFAAVVRLNTVLTAFKVALPLVFVAGVLLVGSHAGFTGAGFHLGCTSAPPEDGTATTQLTAALQAVVTGGLIFSLTGFQGPVDHGSKNGSPHVGFAMFGALFTVTGLYLGLQALVQSQEWHAWPAGVEHWTAAVLLVAIVLSPVANAMLFVSLSREVLRTAADKDIIRFSKHRGDDERIGVKALLAAYLFGLFMLIALRGWTQIITTKSVIFLFVYSFAAIAYAAYRDTDPDGRERFHRSLRVAGPASFAVATALAYYAGVPALPLSYVFIAAVSALMFWTRRNAVYPWTEDLRRARWLFGYFGMLLLLAVIRAAGQIAMSAGHGWATAIEHWHELLLGTRPMPTAEAVGDHLLVHGLAAAAFLLGLWAYYAGVRSAKQHLEAVNRKNEAATAAGRSRG
ncbi:APC family permease [Saccharopolyspora sp. HNM0983]|uniref:APC family permease n=1 Tax=Saccharopolyspora montiporae TaxID=2781240 RepID=A0A929FYP2_9PSEU|nr:APC family permease [Saccharopolyspora sp. HNM0983]